MKKIIITEPLEYNSHLKVGSHHYAKLFSENGYKVLWLSPIYNHLFILKGKKEYNHRKSLHKNKFIKLDENIYGYCPFSLVLYGNKILFNRRFMNKLSIWLTIPKLKTVLKENDFLDVDILWLCNTKYYYLTEIINYKKLIYRCADDISGFKNVCESMKYFEEKMINESDTVFVTSKNLLKKKKKIRDDLVYLPNGVELNNFNRREYICPNDYQSNGRKRCIFVGSINSWIDLDLIKHCAINMKKIDFYYIGPIHIDISSTKGIENLYFMGPRDYTDIPYYLYYSDAALIPFKINDFTNSITPVKLYEYMSVGLNVIATGFKELRHMDSPVFIGENYDDFCDKILLAIDNDENKALNINYANESTWKKRFEKVLKYV